MLLLLHLLAHIHGLIHLLITIRVHLTHVHLVIILTHAHVVTELHHPIVFHSHLHSRVHRHGILLRLRSPIRDLQRLRQWLLVPCLLLNEVDSLDFIRCLVVENKLIEPEVLEVALLCVLDQSLAVLLVELESGVFHVDVLHDQTAEEEELVGQAILKLLVDVDALTAILDTVLVLTNTVVGG